MITLEFLNSLERLLENKDITMQTDCIRGDAKDLIEFISECNRWHGLGENRALVRMDQPHPNIAEATRRYWSDNLLSERAKMQQQNISGYIAEIDTANYRFIAVYRVDACGEIRRLQ